MKAFLDYSEEINEFVCDLDGDPYEGHPYLDPSHNPYIKEVKKITAYIAINDKEILGYSDRGGTFAGTQEWQPSDMQSAIYNIIRYNEPITSIKIKDVSDTKAAVMNELIGLIMIQDNITEAGLQELVLGDWGGVSGPLDNSVLEPFFSKCSSLTALSCTWMRNLHQDNRKAIAQLVATVLAQSPVLKTVDFGNFSDDHGVDEGEVILSALSNSPSLPHLTSFNCSYNRSWFSEGKENNVELLTHALRNMTAVKKLDFMVIMLPSFSACDMLMESLVANRA